MFKRFALVVIIVMMLSAFAGVAHAEPPTPFPPVIQYTLGGEPFVCFGWAPELGVDSFVSGGVTYTVWYYWYWFGSCPMGAEMFDYSGSVAGPVRSQHPTAEYAGCGFGHRCGNGNRQDCMGAWHRPDRLLLPNQHWRSVCMGAGQLASAELRLGMAGCGTACDSSTRSCRRRNAPGRDGDSPGQTPIRRCLRGLKIDPLADHKRFANSNEFVEPQSLTPLRLLVAHGTVSCTQIIIAV